MKGRRILASRLEKVHVFYFRDKKDDNPRFLGGRAELSPGFFREPPEEDGSV